MSVTSPPSSRTVRVFLSSTFRDFAEERDLLVKKVFPELRRRCRERQVELVDVDLRWGITEKQAQRGEVLPICLAEIDRSRPYFMGFIGDRYGWVPEHHQYDLSLLVEQPWLDDHRGGKSVTELEMLHGVLNNPKMAGRAFFYFRNSEYSQTKGGPYLSEGPEDAVKLEALKDKIRAGGFPVEENYPNPEALADKVREDLWKVIDEVYPEEEVPDPLALERRNHEAYGGSRLGLYLGGKQYFQALDAAMGQGTFKPVLITGASGGGKSALIANWSRAYKEKHPDTLEVVHYLGSGADAADPVKLVTRLLKEIARISGDELKLKSDPQKILDALPEWLARASSYAEQEGKEWLILFDGLDKISSLQDLRWWPSFLPPRVKLVVSCLDGEVQDEIRKRMEWSELEVHPFTTDEQRQFITEYLGKYRKSLKPDQVARVQGHPLSGNPLFLRTLLEELRVFGVHEELENKIAWYLESKTVGQLFAKVLERVEGDTDAKDVRSAMEAIWASRAGLSQDELLSLTGLVPATWAPIHNTLDEAIVESGGLIQFGHDYVRKAVEERYLASEELQKQAHVRIAGWFEKQDVTPRIAEELPWQWKQAEEEEQLTKCLLWREMFESCYARDEFELLGYWLSMGKDVSAAYEGVWEEWKKELFSEESEAKLSRDLGNFILTTGNYGVFTKKLHQHSLDLFVKTLGEDHLDALKSLNNIALNLSYRGDYNEAELFFRRSLFGIEKALGLEHPLTLTGLNNLADLLTGMGNFKEAEDIYLRVIEGREKVLGCDHQYTLASLNDLGLLLREKGDYEGAGALFLRTNTGYKKVLGPEHPDTLGSINNLGLLLLEKGDYDEAENLFRRTLEGLEKTVGPEHPLTLTALNNLGISLKERGDLEGSLDTCQQTLRGREKVLGPEHPDTLSTLNNLGTLLTEKGDYDEAGLIFQRVQTGYEKTLCHDHPKVLMILHNQAVIHYASGDDEKAKLLYRQALEGRDKVLGATHPDTLLSLKWLGKLLNHKGDFEGEELLYRGALKKCEESLGVAHAETLNIVELLANSLSSEDAIILLTDHSKKSEQCADALRNQLERLQILNSCPV